MEKDEFERARNFRWVAGPAEGGNEPGDVEVGDRFLVLVAVRVRHDDGKRLYWDSQVVVADEEGWDDPDGDSWCAWTWDDVSWWMSLGKHNLPPLPTTEVLRNDG